MNNPIQYSAYEPELSREQEAHIKALDLEVRSRVDLIRDFRKGLGLSQREVANALGTSQAYVSKLEKTGDPRVSLLSRVADIRGMHVRVLVEANDGEVVQSFKLG